MTKDEIKYLIMEFIEDAQNGLSFSCRDFYERIPAFKENDVPINKISVCLLELVNENIIDRRCPSASYDKYQYCRLNKIHIKWKYLLIPLALWSMRFPPFIIIKMLLGGL